MNGRLGNQLFQYAFAFALSKKFNTGYFIDDSTYKDSFLKYFEPLSIYDSRLIRKVVRRIVAKINFPKVSQTGFEDIESILKQVKNNRWYNGYFQSNLFFFEAAQYIKN
ncbi:MAG TPA: hypothetical protein VM888_11520, partial [Chitinophagaceae bacterium]|nr:hypothetical protein [Chitinophagaceae bacterium]